MFVLDVILQDLHILLNKLFCFLFEKKPRIEETKHLSTDVDKSTDTAVGCTKNTQKPKLFEKPKNLSKTQKHNNP